ncbi:hypothetical protein GCM10009555_016940 [Acrocarpospora macrocephala]|uniref:Thoeris protein ThsA Macro domain-containing protein n=2 Tax=Acrocarpospora macrocephala TaxID=150177 RepID=A0A5M3WEG2_9ACTN|nr:hypothetical protein Amac_009490 [Acrocarpospora macrocephala]
MVSALSSIGILAAVAGILDAFFPDVFEPRGWAYLGIVFAVSVLWATFDAWPLEKYTRNFSELNTTITIEIGDLFEQPGHLVIGMTDTFDTALPRIITERSIQGQLLMREYGGKVTKLDREIARTLKDVQPIKVETVQNKPDGKRKRYSIGTVISLGSVHRYYYCCAYSYMSNALVAQATPESLWTGLFNVWQAVRDSSQQATVSMPLVGSGLAKLSNQLCRKDILRLILLSFVAASRERVVTKHLKIIIHPDDVRDISMMELIETLKGI